jgi:hypothetical protein
MKTILVIGAGSRYLAAALRMLDEDAHIREFVNSVPHIRECDSCTALEPAAEDPFCGGGRSKGEKKRAARQRRLMGGY